MKTIEKKQEEVMDCISDLDWNDNKISEIMEGFFNSPIEAIEMAQGEMSEEHIQSLFELFDLKSEDKQ